MNIEKLRDKRLFLLDIDGTISLDSTLIDGTMEFLNKVREINGKYIFITNNSTKSINDYVDKFKKLQILVDESNFLTSSYVTAMYLKEKFGNDLIFVVGTNSFIEELKSFALNVTEKIDKDIKAVVVGFDNELTYKKIWNVCEILSTMEVEYIATNPDLVCPTGFGFVPDCGAICEMINLAVKKEPLYIGKPNELIVDLSMNISGFSKEQTLVIGDRLYTDIACGINAKVDTAVVFTGEAKMEDIKESVFKPTYCFDTIKDLYLCIK